MKNVLVIGGAGYIGGLTTDFLMKQGYNVTVFDNLMYESQFLKPCDFIYGDIRDTKRLVELQKKYDEIIWLAAIVGDSACAQSPELTREINLNSIKRFLDATHRKIIFASTCSVYGAQHDVLNEESPTNPLSLYASTKLEAEKYVLENSGTIFRLGTVYGVGDRFSRIRLDLVVNVLTL
ncbi:MAG: NAD-dependent epimerase/dehydratase family protein, partial [Thermoplasmata archaeon]|nr:NAD-dependent epimerase/dehydratase family protein [Thermoplasmata archaeon]